MSELEVMSEPDASGMVVKTLDIESITPNPWNPNEMDDETFNRLAEELEDVGYIDPIQVVPMEDGSHQIVGGEHRWRAMRVLGYEKIQCVVLGDEKWKDEDLRKFVTTRLNALRGKLNPQKFMDMYMDLSDRYEEDALQALMGFTDDDAWLTLTKDVRDGLEAAGADKSILDKFDEVSKELKTVDDLAVVLNKMFTEFGDTLDQNFMWFTFGGKEHLYVQCSKETWKRVKSMMAGVQDNGMDANDAFGQLLSDWKDRVELLNLSGDVDDQERARA